MQTISQTKPMNQIKSEGVLYTALFFNVMFTVMNTSMFNVAIPAISNQFVLENATSSWLVTCYSLFFAIGTVLYGRLADSFPIKKLLTLGLALMGLGSIIGMTADHFSTLLVARLVQAAGASSIPGLGMVITSKYVPIVRRGNAMGKIAAGSTLGFGLGPLVGGVLTEYYGWSYLFFITVLGVLTIPIYRAYLPVEKVQRNKIDIIGLLYLCSGVISLLLCITTQTIAYIFGIFCFFLFWRHIQNVSQPFIPPHLLKRKKYLIMLGLSFLVFFMNFSIIFISPLLLSNMFNQTTSHIGLIIFPGAIGSAVASIYIGRFIDKKGPLIVIGLGSIFMLISTFLLSSFTYFTQWTILIFYFIASMGFSCITTGVPNYLSRIFTNEDMGVGLGTLQLIQFFGGAFGVSVSGSLLDSQLLNEQGFNLFWYGGNVQYSNTYLFLFFISILSCVLFVTTRKLLSSDLSIKGGEI